MTDKKKVEEPSLRITNKRPSAIFLPNSNKAVTPEEKDGGLMLYPGENAISSPYWEDIKGKGGVKALLKAGVLEQPVSGTAVSLKDGVDALSGKDLKEYVSSITSIEVLNRLKDQTTKKTLLKVIDARIDAVIEGSE